MEESSSAAEASDTALSKSVLATKLGGMDVPPARDGTLSGRSPSSCCLQSGPGNRSVLKRQAALRRDRWTGVSSLRSIEYVVVVEIEPLEFSPLARCVEIDALEFFALARCLGIRGTGVFSTRSMSASGTRIHDIWIRSPPP
eukprot:2945854-Amphidinium_carterae.1